MDLSTMTFQEILFHGRYHIIGGILFLVFFSVFIQEAAKEIRAEFNRRRGSSMAAHGPRIHDDMVGLTMADGGEPVEDED